MVRDGSPGGPGKPSKPGRPDGSDETPTEALDYATSRPPSDLGSTPARDAEYSRQERLPPAEAEKHTPRFLRRAVLIAWITLIVMMIALVIWGIIQLTSRGPGDITGPDTAPSTTPATSTSPGMPTSTPTTTTPITPATTPKTAVTTAAPPSARAPAPAPPGGGTPNQPPRHRHHLPPLPSVITIPPIPKAPQVPTVITLPPHL